MKDWIIAILLAIVFLFAAAYFDSKLDSYTHQEELIWHAPRT